MGGRSFPTKSKGLLKYQGETPLDHQYTLNKKKMREGQEGKINLFWGGYLWKVVAQRKGE
jgi:hypothetical protein